MKFESAWEGGNEVVVHVGVIVGDVESRLPKWKRLYSVGLTMFLVRGITMIVATTDEKRRLTMPKDLPAKSAVTIERLNADSWVVTRQKSKGDVVMVALPRIDELPSDPEWEAAEKKMAKHNNRKLPRFLRVAKS